VGIPPERVKGDVLTTLVQANSEQVKCLRQLKHLAIVEVNLTEERGHKPPGGAWKRARETWERELISLLKNVPSTDSKILRWKIVQSSMRRYRSDPAYEVVETKELEVFPGASL